MHFDTPFGGVVEGTVVELVEDEVRLQLPIDPRQEVAIERGRDALPGVAQEAPGKQGHMP
jgi:hypothetical protein